MSEDIEVGNLGNRPAVRRPLPKKPDGETAAGPTVGNADDIAALNYKMDQVLKFMQAIDWKMWVYLKANNYID